MRSTSHSSGPITVGRNHTLAVRADGSLYAWGYNSYGQVGDGTTTDRISPVRLSPVSPTWSRWPEAFARADERWHRGPLAIAGDDYSPAGKSDGTL